MTHFRYKLLIFHRMVQMRNIKYIKPGLLEWSQRKEKFLTSDILSFHEIIASDIKLNG